MGKDKTKKEALCQVQYTWYLLCIIMNNTRGLSLGYLLKFTTYELEQYYKRLFPGDNYD